MCTSFGISSVLSQSVGGERPEIGNFSRSLGVIGRSLRSFIKSFVCKAGPRFLGYLAHVYLSIYWYYQFMSSLFHNLTNASEN